MHIYTKKKHQNSLSKIKYSHMALGQQHLACSFMPACLRCRTLVDTYVLLYVLCYSVHSRLEPVLLCLRYVDTVAFGASFSAFFVVCAGEEQKQVQKQKTSRLVVFLGSRMASKADDTASFDSVSPRRAPPQHSCSPLGWYSPVP